MDGTIIGTCGHCGGPVTVPYFSTVPVVQCAQCGRVAVNAFGEVLDMGVASGYRKKECGWRDYYSLEDDPDNFRYWHNERRLF